MKSLDAKTFDRILSRRGCCVVRTKGGHVIWRTPDGGTITSIGAGRKTLVAPHLISQAAKKLDVTIPELLATRKGSSQ